MRAHLFSLAAACAAALACGASSSGASPGDAPPLSTPEQGVATYYDATGAGACSFDPTPNDLDVAAMDKPEWAGSAVCGACADVKGPKGEVTVRIVDQCPECEKGHLDLSQEAFAKIADVSAGKVPITWSLVPCAVQGPVQYHFKDGSSQWWTAIQVRNHKVPVSKLEVQVEGGAWTDVSRADYNYFVAQSGVGPDPFQVRITSQDGHVLVDSLPAVQPNTTVSGAAQFP